MPRRCASGPSSLPGRSLRLSHRATALAEAAPRACNAGGKRRLKWTTRGGARTRNRIQGSLLIGVTTTVSRQPRLSGTPTIRCRAGTTRCQRIARLPMLPIPRTTMRGLTETGEVPSRDQGSGRLIPSRSIFRRSAGRHGEASVESAASCRQCAESGLRAAGQDSFTLPQGNVTRCD